MRQLVVFCSFPGRFGSDDVSFQLGDSNVFHVICSGLCGISLSSELPTLI